MRRSLFTNFKQSIKVSLNPYVPSTNVIDRDEIDRLADFFYQSNKLVAITGAGISTASGIPDYRGPEGSYKKGHKPINHSEFVNQLSSRQRYWCRSMNAWDRMTLTKPNRAHYALFKLENWKTRFNQADNDQGLLQSIVTQNVDGLHQKAGSKRVIDLHGKLSEVICLECGEVSSRLEMQDRLIEDNPDFYYQNLPNEKENTEKLMRADGDVDLEMIDFSKFHVPCCLQCGGVLKPNMVFFGDNVPRPKVDNIIHNVDQADSLLIVGTSLEVFSAFRFVVRASERKIPIAIINFGETRAERKGLPGIIYKSEANCELLLDQVIQELGI